jgi:hypothetical protein
VIRDPADIADLSVARWRESAAQCDLHGQRSNTVSRHHIMPPALYTPPKPKETRLRRGYAQGADAGARLTRPRRRARSPPRRRRAALSHPSTRVSVGATERRLHSTTGKPSEGTLKVMLEEQEGKDGTSM